MAQMVEIEYCLPNATLTPYNFQEFGHLAALKFIEAMHRVQKRTLEPYTLPFMFVKVKPFILHLLGPKNSIHLMSGAHFASGNRVGRWLRIQK